MAKHKIRASFSASWTETHEVEIPDGLDAAALDKWIDRWTYTHSSDGPPYQQIDCDEASVPGYAIAPTDLTLLPVPDADWIVGNDCRWATDGHVILREGSPMPSEMGSEGGRGKTIRPWRVGLELETIETLLGAVGATAQAHPGIFHRRFAPVFAGASVVGTGPLEPAYVFRDGVLVAVVMPMQTGAADAIRVSA